MSTEIKTSHPQISFAEFWGGADRGTCLQINVTDYRTESQFHRTIQLTRDQAEALAIDLLEWLHPTPPLTPAQLDRLQAKVRETLGAPLPVCPNCRRKLRPNSVVSGWLCPNCGAHFSPDHFVAKEVQP
jgi:tRNA(Ile2) C34 agmatinyltransferase TiaS